MEQKNKSVFETLAKHELSLAGFDPAKMRFPCLSRADYIKASFPAPEGESKTARAKRLKSAHSAYNKLKRERAKLIKAISQGANSVVYGDSVRIDKDRTTATGSATFSFKEEAEKEIIRLRKERDSRLCKLSMNQVAEWLVLNIKNEATGERELGSLDLSVLRAHWKPSLPPSNEKKKDGTYKDGRWTTAKEKPGVSNCERFASDFNRFILAPAKQAEEEREAAKREEAARKEADRKANRRQRNVTAKEEKGGKNPARRVSGPSEATTVRRRRSANAKRNKDSAAA